MNKDKQIKEIKSTLEFNPYVPMYQDKADILAQYMYNERYRKLSENVIELPCKVGDTVYMPWEYKGVSGVAILKVTHVIIDDVHSYIRTDFDSDCEEYKQKYNYGRFDFREFGEKVFTSQKAAAEALEKIVEGSL